MADGFALPLASLALGRLTRDNAKRVRYETLVWNHRLHLLDALIDKIADFEPPTALARFSVRLRVSMPRPLRGPSMPRPLRGPRREPTGLWIGST